MNQKRQKERRLYMNENNQLHEFVKKTINSADISDQHKKVLEMRLDQQSLEYIGKELNLSRERIRQIEKEGIEVLNELLYPKA